MKFSVCSALIAFASVASAQALYSNKTTTLGPILHEHSTTLLEVPTGVSIASDKDMTSTVTLLTTITLDHPHAVPVTRNSTDVSKATSMGTNTTPTQVYSTSTSTSVSVETITPSTGAPYTTATTVETPVLYASCPPEKTVTVTEYATTQFVTVTYTPSASVSFNPSSTAYYGNNTVTY